MVLNALVDTYFSTTIESVVLNKNNNNNIRFIERSGAIASEVNKQGLTNKNDSKPHTFRHACTWDNTKYVLLHNVKHQVGPALVKVYGPRFISYTRRLINS